MIRNVKDTYNSPNYPVADAGCQIWLGGGGGGGHPDPEITGGGRS